MRGAIVYVLGVPLSGFILYTTLIGEPPPLPQRAIPLSLAGVRMFLLYRRPAASRRPARRSASTSR